MKYRICLLSNGFYDTCVKVLSRKFGHPMQISMQVQLLVTCDYLQGHLASTLDIYRDVAKGWLPAYFFSWTLTQKQRLEKTLKMPGLKKQLLATSLHLWNNVNKNNITVDFCVFCDVSAFGLKITVTAIRSLS